MDKAAPWCGREGARRWLGAALVVAAGVLADGPSFGASTPAKETPGLSRADGKSEPRLLEVLGLMSRGENREALSKVEKLVADHPNFQLAQLIYGDLLTARTRALQTIGDMPAETARAGAAALSANARRAPDTSAGATASW